MARRLLARRRAEYERVVRRRRPADEFDVVRAVDGALAPRRVDQLEAARSAEDDRDRARRVPIIGPISGGGAIPGSRPGVTGKLGRWSGR